MKNVTLGLVPLVALGLWACSSGEDGEDGGPPADAAVVPDTPADSATPDAVADAGLDAPPAVADGYAVVTLVRRTETGADVEESYTVEPWPAYAGGYDCVGSFPMRCQDFPWIWRVSFELPLGPGWGCTLPVHYAETATNTPPVVGTTLATDLPLPACGVAREGGQPGTFTPTRTLDVAGDLSIDEVVPVDTVSGAFEGNFTVAYEPSTGLGDAVAFSVKSVRFRRLAFVGN